MDSYAECSIRLVLEVIRVSVHHQEYMAEIIIRDTQIRVKGGVSSGEINISHKIMVPEWTPQNPELQIN